MRLNQRFLTVGLATTLGLGVLAPMAGADRVRTDITIGLGAASVALLANHHYAAGVVGLGLTALAAESRPCREVCVEPVVRVERPIVIRRDFRDHDRGRW